MKDFVRWTLFTLAVTAVGLAGAFLLLYAGRLYGSANSAAMVFAALVAFCASVTVAAIAFASKIEDEQQAALTVRETDPEP